MIPQNGTDDDERLKMLRPEIRSTMSSLPTQPSLPDIRIGDEGCERWSGKVSFLVQGQRDTRGPSVDPAVPERMLKSF